MSWLTTEQALNLLDTKQQTLYANVSRGRIRAKPDPTDTRRSLYLADDVQRLAARRLGRRKSEAVAAETIKWGDPLLTSGISTVSNGRLFYRGVDAVVLSEHGTLEEVAALLWDLRGSLESFPLVEPIDEPATAEAALVALAYRATKDLPSLGRSPGVLQAESQSVLGTVASVLAPWRSDLPLHRRLAESWRRPAAALIIRRALVLLADHELNASTFAARVTASAGSSLSAATLSGMATLMGPLHGGAWQGLDSLIGDVERVGPREAIRVHLAQARALPAFGHPLYPEGDIRAATLLSHFKPPAIFVDLQNAAEEMVGERGNVDFALSAIASAFDLPRNAPFIIFALARTVGWLAHAMEQVTSGNLIRPRARYDGPRLQT